MKESMTAHRQCEALYFSAYLFCLFTFFITSDLGAETSFLQFSQSKVKLSQIDSMLQKASLCPFTRCHISADK